MGKSVDRKQVDDYKLSLVRFRDVVKKNFDGIELVVLGLELQEHIHYGMPLRTMIYDSLGYLKEFEGVRKGSRLLCVKHGKSIMMKQDRMGLSLVKNRDIIFMIRYGISKKDLLKKYSEKDYNEALSKMAAK